MKRQAIQRLEQIKRQFSAIETAIDALIQKNNDLLHCRDIFLSTAAIIATAILIEMSKL